MAEGRPHLDSQKFCCSVCLDLLKDPVTVSCGHSYCSDCIKGHWDVENQKGVYSCPECRETFRQRPKLKKNIMLSELVEDLRKTGLPASSETSEKQKVLDASRVNIQKIIREREKYVELLQGQIDALNASADKAVEHSEESFSQMICLIQRRSHEVKQQLRSQLQAAVSEDEELKEKFVQEINHLKRKDVQLDKLAQTDDHNRLLHRYPPVSGFSDPIRLSNIHTASFGYFEDLAAAVSESREQIHQILTEMGTNVSLRATEEEVLLPQAQPETREDFLQYSQQIHLDTNTAYSQMLLSDRKRIVTYSKQHQPYPDHPDRFTTYSQVLSRESLTGRVYWEVEWRGTVNISVAYKNISRSGRHSECLFGRNNKSWALLCDSRGFTFRHNNRETPVSGPRSSRVGVYLDHRAGILSFYSISKTMTLLYMVQTTFSQPLHAGVWLYCNEVASAEFVKPE